MGLTTTAEHVIKMDAVLCAVECGRYQLQWYFPNSSHGVVSQKLPNPDKVLPGVGQVFSGNVERVLSLSWG